MIRKCLVALNDNTIRLFDIVDKQEKFFHAILNLLEEVMMDKMSLDVLSIYNDYITDLIEEIETKLDTDTWSKLENELKDVKMTVSEFELLMEMKAMSNTEFHKGKRRVLKEVRKQLETSLSNNLQVFKVPLRKLLCAHEIRKLSK
ncbi:hypothetical protein RhiirA4_473276 [Rhizophagus irregularis]|uniref:Uncharacterized protein n=1 Tax=Rhizophagus irregularis TaxID=588596 RepID=A0A2I1H6E4_9GLOM|nr:hypothetical protein RhiirA4_473276 [Rhizophagus irregularis]